MAESIIINALDKENRYLELIPQVKSLILGESDQIANLANVASALKYCFDWLWVGFYLVKNDMLVLGPFQGPIACTRIPKGRGVCGVCFETKETMIVPDVNQFPGHIACSSLSQSEIVLLLLNSKNECIGVLDIDSVNLNDFDEIDKKYLLQITALLK